MMMMMTLFALSLAAAADPQPKPTTAVEQAATASDKVICKRFTETGSLVSSYKTCKTKREWDIEREALRATGPGMPSCANLGEGRSC